MSFFQKIQIFFFNSIWKSESAKAKAKAKWSFIRSKCAVTIPSFLWVGEYDSKKFSHKPYCNDSLLNFYDPLSISKYLIVSCGCSRVLAVNVNIPFAISYRSYGLFPHLSIFLRFISSCYELKRYPIFLTDLHCCRYSQR